MALTDTGIRQLKHSGAKVGDKISDGGGMYLLVTATAKRSAGKGIVPADDTRARLPAPGQ